MLRKSFICRKTSTASSPIFQHFYGFGLLKNNNNNNLNACKIEFGSNSSSSNISSSGTDLTAATKSTCRQQQQQLLLDDYLFSSGLTRSSWFTYYQAKTIFGFYNNFENNNNNNNPHQNLRQSCFLRDYRCGYYSKSNVENNNNNNNILFKGVNVNVQIPVLPLKLFSASSSLSETSSETSSSSSSSLLFEALKKPSSLITAIRQEQSKLSMSKYNIENILEKIPIFLCYDSKEQIWRLLPEKYQLSASLMISSSVDDGEEQDQINNMIRSALKKEIKLEQASSASASLIASELKNNNNDDADDDNKNSSSVASSTATAEEERKAFMSWCYRKNFVLFDFCLESKEEQKEGEIGFKSFEEFMSEENNNNKIPSSCHRSLTLFPIEQVISSTSSSSSTIRNFFATMKTPFLLDTPNINNNFSAISKTSVLKLEPEIETTTKKEEKEKEISSQNNKAKISIHKPAMSAPLNSSIVATLIAESNSRGLCSPIWFRVVENFIPHNINNRNKDNKENNKNNNNLMKNWMLSCSSSSSNQFKKDGHLINLSSVYNDNNNNKNDDDNNNPNVSASSPITILAGYNIHEKVAKIIQEEEFFFANKQKKNNTSSSLDNFLKRNGNLTRVTEQSESEAIAVEDLPLEIKQKLKELNRFPAWLRNELSSSNFGNGDEDDNEKINNNDNNKIFVLGVFGPSNKFPQYWKSIKKAKVVASSHRSSTSSSSPRLFVTVPYLRYATTCQDVSQIADFISKEDLDSDSLDTFLTKSLKYNNPHHSDFISNSNSNSSSSGEENDLESIKQQQQQTRKVARGLGPLRKKLETFLSSEINNNNNKIIRIARFPKLIRTSLYVNYDQLRGFVLKKEQSLLTEKKNKKEIEQNVSSSLLLKKSTTTTTTTENLSSSPSVSSSSSSSEDAENEKKVSL